MSSSASYQLIIEDLNIYRKLFTHSKASQVAEQLRRMKLAAAAKKVEESIEETPTFMNFPSQHWTSIRTNNTPERLN